MAEAIWKFTFGVDDHPKVVMPLGARILSVGAEGDLIAVWARVNPSPITPKVTRKFRVYGTGHTLDTEPRPEYRDGTEPRFVGTVIMDVPAKGFSVPHARFVWHVFDAGS